MLLPLFLSRYHSLDTISRSVVALLQLFSSNCYSVNKFKIFIYKNITSSSCQRSLHKTILICIRSVSIASDNRQTPLSIYPRSKTQQMFQIVTYKILICWVLYFDNFYWKPILFNNIILDDYSESIHHEIVCRLSLSLLHSPNPFSRRFAIAQKS